MQRWSSHSVLRVASIDIGTNSVRLLVADVGADGGFRRVFMDRRITRLGAGLRRLGSMGVEAVKETLETLCVFVKEARRQGAKRTLAAATGAVRDAKNGRAFVDRVSERTGLMVRVLSGEEEAHWMMQGISQVWRHPPHGWMIVDVGGGSTEFVKARGCEVENVRSIPFGMVHLTEEIIHHDPPLADEIDRCCEVARTAFKESLSMIGAFRCPPAVLVGTAGTITTLAALDLALDTYDGDRVNGYRLQREDVDRWGQILSGMNNLRRRELPGMEPGREDVILAGVLMFSQLMNLLGSEEIHVSDYGLLEGIAIMAAQKERYVYET